MNGYKTSMDMDSSTYKFVRSQMIEMMRPVMTLMNYLKKEKEGDTPKEERTYNNLVSGMKTTPLTSIFDIENKLSDHFEFPSLLKKEKNQSKEKRILYYRSEEKLNKIKNSLGVKTAGEVGEKTFDYYYDMEVE